MVGRVDDPVGLEGVLLELLGVADGYRFRKVHWVPQTLTETLPSAAGCARFFGFVK